MTLIDRVEIRARIELGCESIEDAMLLYPDALFAIASDEMGHIYDNCEKRVR